LYPFSTHKSGALGRIGVFTHLKCQKRIGDNVGDLKYVFTTTKKNKKNQKNPK
jgi:hypothetical protein